jgi:hypothetical protein
MYPLSPACKAAVSSSLIVVSSYHRMKDDRMAHLASNRKVEVYQSVGSWFFGG